jgi:hypothetical protein
MRDLLLYGLLGCEFGEQSRNVFDAQEKIFNVLQKITT